MFLSFDDSSLSILLMTSSYCYQYKIRYDGNSFDNGPAPPPPPYTAPPPGSSHNNQTGSGSGSHAPPDIQLSDSDEGLSLGSIVGIILGAVVLAALVLLTLCYCVRKNKRKVSGTRTSAGGLPFSITNGGFLLLCFYSLASPILI